MKPYVESHTRIRHMQRPAVPCATHTVTCSHVRSLAAGRDAGLPVT